MGKFECSVGHVVNIPLHLAGVEHLLPKWSPEAICFERLKSIESSERLEQTPVQYAM